MIRAILDKAEFGRSLRGNRDPKGPRALPLDASRIFTRLFVNLAATHYCEMIYVRCKNLGHRGQPSAMTLEDRESFQLIVDGGHNQITS